MVLMIGTTTEPVQILAVARIMLLVGLAYAVVRVVVHLLRPRLGDDRAVAICGLIAGLLAGASGLGLIMPDLYQTIFEAGAAEREVLQTFDRERQESREVLEMTGVTGVAVVEYDNQTERLREPLEEAVEQAGAGREAMLRWITMLLLIPAIIGSVIHAKQHEAREQRWESILPALIAVGGPVLIAGLLGWWVHDWLFGVPAVVAGTAMPMGLSLAAGCLALAVFALPLPNDLLTTLKLGLRQSDEDVPTDHDLPLLLTAMAGWVGILAMVSMVGVLAWTSFESQSAAGLEVSAEEAGRGEGINLLLAALIAGLLGLFLMIGSWIGRAFDHLPAMRRSLAMLLPWLLFTLATWGLLVAGHAIGLLESGDLLVLVMPGLVVGGAFTAGMTISHSGKLGASFDRSWRVISLPAAGVGAAMMIAPLNLWSAIDFTSPLDWLALIVVLIIVGDLRAISSALAIRFICYRPWPASLESGIILASGDVFPLIIAVTLHWAGLISDRLFAFLLIATLLTALLSGWGLRLISLILRPHQNRPS